MILHGLSILLFASTLVVKQDQAQLRSGCEARDEVVAALPAGSPIEIRFAMTGATETCYKVATKVNGKALQGYLPASALTGLEEFDKARQSAPSVGSSAPPRQQTLGMTAPAVNGPPDHPLVKASALLDQQKPREALEVVEKAMRVTGRDYQYLVLAGIAAYESDEAKKALDYLKEAAQLKQDAGLQQMIARVEKEVIGDKSGDRLLGNRFLLRYEGGVLDTDVARNMVSLLEEEYGRISNELGCRAADRLVTIVQSKQAYRASTDAAEWSGGQFDGKIRIPVSETKSISAETRKTVAHEVVHACLTSMGNWPSWLHEGLAQKLSGDTLTPSHRAMLKAAIKQGTLPKLGNMSQSWSRMSSVHAAVAYAYALSAVDLMMEQYRAYGIQNILRNPERLPQIAAELDKGLGL
jgi:tetratricopeptide (TPR) repeat protein